jgi:hypothetical protein
MYKKVWIFGHWGSCNMGDKYQSYSIAKHILNTPNITVKYVNYSNHVVNNIKQPMMVDFNETQHELLGPLDFEEPYDCDYVILTTGSISDTSPYIITITKLLLNSNIKIIIWGGFSRGNTSFKNYLLKFDFLSNNNIEYFARSYRDLMLYRKLVNNNTKGRLAGDPMVWWCLDKNIDFGLRINNKQAPSFKGTVVIPSIHAITHNTQLWTTLIEKADHVVFIDSFADNQIKLKYKGHMITEPWLFLQAIKDCSHIITGRLHSGVLSICSNIPTTMIITDNAKPETGSFKFDAVGNTGVSINGPLCRVMTSIYAMENIEECLEIPDNSIYAENIKKYKELTINSLNIIENDLLNI